MKITKIMKPDAKTLNHLFWIFERVANEIITRYQFLEEIF